jgi:two-component system, LytTR family, sensor kinase
MKITLKNLPDSIPLFWILQTIGFCGYAIDRWIQGPEWFFPVGLGYIVTAFALTLCLRPVYHKVWERSPSVWKIGLIVFFCSILTAYLWLLVSMAAFRRLGWMEPATLPLHQHLIQTFKGTLTHHKPFLFLSWSALYFGIKYWRQSQQEQQQALRAAALAKEAELQMLRYQLNPHFLFNSLNSAIALIRENPARAEKMIGELSEFLRYSLANGKAGDAPLSDELEAARNYLDIEKIRFEDKLIVSFDIEPNAGEFRVPSMLIHPLVENAVKYGMQTSPMPLRVEINARADNGALRLEVINTGRWIEDSTNGRGANIGIENVRQRLRQAFPERHRFDVFEREGLVHAVMEVGRRKQ